MKGIFFLGNLMDKTIISLLGIAAVVIVIGILSIFYLESGQPGSQINHLLDAVWWTVATVTTVGYGDIVPVTDVGRIVSVFYMFFGITILGIAVSVLATRVYKRRFENDKEISHAQKLILEKLQDLENNQKKLQKEIGDLTEKINNSKKNS